MAIFRRFSDLNTLSLLSLQAEILELRDDFYDTCEEDDRYDSERCLFSTSMLELLWSTGSQNGKQYEQLLKIHNIMEQ